MPIQRVNPDALAPPVQDLYSHAAIGTGSRFIAIAGQIALDSDGDLVDLETMKHRRTGLS